MDKTTEQDIKPTRAELEKQIQIIAKCKKSIVYFAEHFFLIMDENHSFEPIKLTKDQKTFLKAMDKHLLTVCVGRRCGGKSTMLCIFALWKSLFTFERNVVILASSTVMAREDMRKIQIAYDYLPTWMRFKIPLRNQTLLKFQNGSSILAMAASGHWNLKGSTVRDILCDEFALFKYDDAVAIQYIWSMQMSTMHRKSQGGTFAIATSLQQQSGHPINGIWKNVNEKDAKASAWHQCTLFT